MTTLDFVRLFRALLSARAPLETAAIERMGLFAVKIAQMYAVRPDIVGVEKCTKLSRLLQRTEPLSHRDFDDRWRKLSPAAFEAELKFRNPVPLASASLGQVNRATLRDGRQVVVKILRRDMRDEFLDDVRRARRLLRFAVTVYPRLGQLADPIGTLEAVERQTLTEMNFLAEPAGTARLASMASERRESLPHLQRLHFPTFFPEFSHDRFLVSEFIEGETLADWLGRGALPYDALLELFRIHGYFLFVRGEFHGDLHPGNVIWRNGEFWFLDNANIETIPPAFARALFDMMVALGEGDLRRATQQLLDVSITPLTAKQHAEFQSAFTALYRGFAGRTVCEVSLTRQMMETVKAGVRCGLHFPRGAFPLIKSLMYLDGMVLRCNPRAVLLRDVGRFADDFRACASCDTPPPAAGFHSASVLTTT
jgi:ubiquinone biosynthesis protein